MTVVRETARLVLRHLTVEDAPFASELVNDADWLRFIGDKGVRTLDDAVGYLEQGPLRSYAEHGFGLYGVALREGGALVGICGLVKRPTLDDVDVGFAFLPAARGAGYCTEAGTAVLDHAWRDCRLPRLVAITTVDNHASMAVLRRLGFSLERLVALTPGTPELNLFACERPAAS